MYNGFYSDKYNGKKKSAKERKWHPPTYSADRGLIQKHKFVNFFRQAMRMRPKV